MSNEILRCFVVRIERLSLPPLDNNASLHGVKGTNQAKAKLYRFNCELF